MSIFKDLRAIIAMLIVAAVLIICIVNDINHGLIYSGIVIISGLGGFVLHRIASKK